VPVLPRRVLIGIALFVLVYVVLDLNKLYALRYGADQGTFLQFLADEARRGSSWNGAEWRPHLQMHGSWTLLALVPLVALWPRAETLLVVQVLAVALAAIPIFAFARVCGAGTRGASAVAFAYLLSPFTQGFAYGEFSENVFVPLLAASGALAVARRAVVPALAIAALLAGIKEDEALFLVWFGAACAMWWDRRIGLGIVALAIVDGLTFVLLERIHHVVPSIPGYQLAVDDPVQKMTFFVTLLATAAFAPLALGPRILLAAPLVAELAFAKPWAYLMTRIGTHWTPPVFTAAILATAYVVARRPAFARPVLVCGVLAALVLNDTALKPGRWPFLVDWTAYERAYALRDAGRRIVVDRADEGVYAVAASNLNVVLSPRRDPARPACPGYNRDAWAFFASLRWGAPPSGTTLCGGVPISRK
jgi:uncharacterized membrane protein